MQCSKCCIWKKTLLNFIRSCRNNVSLHIVHAGLIVFLVPLVICDSDRASHLSYDSIFNNTNYPQIQNRRPYQILNLSLIRPHKENVVNTNYYYQYKEIENDNELEYEEIGNNNDPNVIGSNEQLLVGYSYDPFRYSIPEADYVKGDRIYIPQSSSDMKNESRGKRGVAHLYNMIYCATGCEPLSYKGYGCYCGFLGSGRATDGIDKCCKMHDQCYENLYCPFFTVYFQPYYWKCYLGEPLCALENHATRNQLINGCAGRLCECDRQLAMCLRQYRCPRRRALCRSSPLRLLQNILMAR